VALLIVIVAPTHGWGRELLAVAAPQLFGADELSPGGVLAIGRVSV